MRTGWKILGGTTAAGLVAAALVVGNSGLVEGDDSVEDTADASSADSPSADQPPAVMPHDPNKPYPLGPHAIEFDQLSSADKAAIELVQETLETSQPASSYQAWAAGTAVTGQVAEAQIAAHAVGLVGTDLDGVAE